MRSPRRILAASTLVLEAFVVFFAALVAKDLSGLSPSTALTGGGLLGVSCLLVAGSVPRPVGVMLGWVLQVGLVVTGIWVPMMFGIGVLFAALWAVSLYWGARIERERALVAAELERRRGTA